MTKSVEPSIQAGRRPPRRPRLLAAAALTLALAAGGGAAWLLAVGREAPWNSAFAELNDSSEICRTEADASAHAAAQVALAQAQVDNFVRQRLDQFLVELRQTPEQDHRQAVSALPARGVTDGEAARLENRLNEMIAERARLLERLTAEHPAVVNLEQQIVALNGQIAARPAVVREPEPSRNEAEPVPVAAWRELVERSVVEYDQLAALCRRAERHLDEAQVGHATALDGHLSTLARWSEAASMWSTLLARPAAVAAGLAALAAAAISSFFWLVARASPADHSVAADPTLTDVAEIERWFSLPTVAISALAGNLAAPAAEPRRRFPTWLALPAQFALAVGVFCLVAVAIQNATWLGTMWAR